MFPVSESKRSVSCQFETAYMCGYNMHPFNHDGVVWKRKYDNGFVLADGSRVRGKCYPFTGLLPDTQNCGMRMRQECQER